MMAKTTVSIAMLMSLMLVALPAAAEHRTRDKREPTVEKVAYKLAAATHALHAEAHDARGHSRAYRYAVASLHDLDRSANAFSHRVQRDGIYAHTTQRAFQRLERAYETAVYRVEHLRHRRHLRDDVARVGRLMSRLDTQLAGLDRRHDRYRHHARYDSRRDRWRAAFAWNF